MSTSRATSSPPLPKLLLAAIAVSLSMSVVATASAQVSPEAEALFQEGRKLLKAGKIAAACEKFEASDKLESSLGAILNLASCREKNGELATAWALFVKAASIADAAADERKRADFARRRAAKLEPRLSYLTVSVPDASRVEGLQIHRGEELIDEVLWNQKVPVNPGEYDIRAHAPGHEPWTTTITVPAEGGKVSVDVPRFKQLRDLVEPTSSAADEDEAVTSRPGRFTTMRKGAAVAAAAGLVSLGVGVAYGLSARSLQADADELCPNQACPDPRGVELNEDARSKAGTANLLLGAGVVLTGAAVALWFLGAPAKDPDRSARAQLQPMLNHQQVGVAFRGSF